jgi:hypothetical protein
MVFRWRVQFGFAGKKAAKLATVALPGAGIGGSSTPPPAVLHDLLQAPDGMTPVQLSDGRRVFAPEGSDPDAVRQHVHRPLLDQVIMRLSLDHLGRDEAGRNRVDGDVVAALLDRERPGQAQ